MLRSAALLAMRLENSGLLVFTRSGDLAAKLGALRPNGAPLFAFTDVEGLHRRLRLIWGIEPFFMNFSEDPEITIQHAIDRLKKEKWIKEGDSLVTVTNAFAHNRVVESIQLKRSNKRNRHYVFTNFDLLNKAKETNTPTKGNVKPIQGLIRPFSPNLRQETLRR